MKFWILVCVCLLVSSVRCQENEEEEGAEIEDPVIENRPEVPIEDPVNVPAPTAEEEKDDPVEGPTHASNLFNERLDAIIRKTIDEHRSEILPYRILPES